MKKYPILKTFLESMSSSEDEQPVKKEKAGKQDIWAGSDDSDGSDDWTDSSDDSSSEASSDSDSEVETGDGEFARYTIEYFLKKPDSESKKKKKAARNKAPKGPKEPKAGKEPGDDWTKVQLGQNQAMSVREDGTVQIFAKDVDINPKNVIQKLAEIQAQRPRKEADRSNKVKFLEELVRLVIKNKLGPALELKVRMSIVFALYDYNSKNKGMVLYART